MGVLKAKVAGNWVDVMGAQAVTTAPVYWRSNVSSLAVTTQSVLTPVTPRGTGFTIVGTRVRCDLPGTYLVQFLASSSGTAGQYVTTQIRHYRGALLTDVGSVSAENVWSGITGINVYEMLAGDELDFQVGVNAAQTVDGGRSYITITQVGTNLYPAPTADPDLNKLLQCVRNNWYSMRAYRLAAFNIPAASSETPLPQDVEEYDYANCYDPTTGIYVVPVNGIYHIVGHLNWTSSTVNEHIELQVRVDGIDKADSNKFLPPVVGQSPAVIVDTDLKLNAGQQVRLVVGHYVGATTCALFVSGNLGSRNYFNISLIGML